MDSPEDIAKVPGSHLQQRAGDGDGDDAYSGSGGGGGRGNHADNDDGSDGDGSMWAIMTRKCHWLGPCEAVRSSGPTDRDGADTEWVVRGGVLHTCCMQLTHSASKRTVFPTLEPTLFSKYLLSQIQLVPLKYSTCTAKGFNLYP